MEVWGERRMKFHIETWGCQNGPLSVMARRAGAGARAGGACDRGVVLFIGIPKVGAGNLEIQEEG
jgi:hypothetical protein